MKKLLSFVLCVVLIGSVAVPAFAVDATVDYCRVKIVVDGATIVPKDADGKPVEPFIWKGTTYLPVRSVANALGLEVVWEPGTVKLTSGGSRTAAIGKPTESQRTRTISMGGQDTKVTLDGKELTLKDAAGNPVTPIISGGVTYLPVRAIADAVNVPVLWDGENVTVYLGEAIEWKKADEYSRFSNGTIWTERYTYDKQGNILTESWESDLFGQGRDLSSASYHYTYDDQNRKIRSDRLDKPEWTTYAYDSIGRLTETASSRGDILYYSYDASGLVVELRDSFKGQPSDRLEVTVYDERGNILRNSVYNNDEMIYEYLYTYTYDDAGQMVKETADSRWKMGSQQHTECYYEYNEQGRLVKEQHFKDGELDEFYQYDDQGILIAKMAQFDKAIETIQSYKVNDGNQLLYASWDSSEDIYMYDAWGNCTQIMENGTVVYTCTYTPIYH